MIPLSLNQNSCQDLALIEFIKKAKGFKGVELHYASIEDFILSGKNPKDLKETLELYSLAPTSIYALEDFSLSSETEFKRTILPEFHKMMETCYQLETYLLLVRPSPLDEGAEISPFIQGKIIERTRKRLELLAGLAYKEDLNLGFEFLYESSVPTLADAKKIIMPLESNENIGYIIDLYSLNKSKENYSELSEIKNHVFLIQLCDINFDDLNNSERLPPGKGDFKFRNFFEFLRKSFIQRKFSLELEKDQCSKTILNQVLQYFKNIS